VCGDREKNKRGGGKERRLKWDYEGERAFKHAQRARASAIDNWNRNNGERTSDPVERIVITLNIVNIIIHSHILYLETSNNYYV
jgi:hypothetical protein